MSRIEFDFQHLQLSGDVIDNQRKSAGEAVDAMRRLHADGRVGFWDLPRDVAMAHACTEYARQLPERIENFVVLGIGGSALGGRALHSALAPALDNLRPRGHTPRTGSGKRRRLFFPDNIDPVTFSSLLELCPPERTVWNVVTKSGGTAETAAQFLVVLERLEAAVGREHIVDHVVLTTDPVKGALRKVAGELGVRTFDLPSSVGGRFSVLSAVGLLPAAAAGIDVEGLLSGAADMAARVENERDPWKNPALLFALALHHHDRHHHRPIHVMMPYADGLYETALWFQQLWAESLGKAKSIKGETVNVGPTPLACRGATDQHSQLQLFVEGPDDKVMLFLGVKDRGVEVPIPRRLSHIDEYAYLGGHGLGELLDVELLGTRLALTEARRPNATLSLGRVDAPTMGELLHFFQAATAFAGPLYGVDPFDQPGVEQGKRFAFGLLGRQGYEEYGQKVKDQPAGDPRFIL